MCLLDQSGVTGGGFDPCNVHTLFVNIDNMWTERFGNAIVLFYNFKRVLLTGKLVASSLQCVISSHAKTKHENPIEKFCEF